MSGPLDVGSLIALLETTDIQSGQAVRDLVLDNLRNNKEAWLVNGLVDSFVLSRSDQCLEIIIAVSEPHDKHLLDRLLDHMKGPHKLAALTILATLVYKQPSWLHKMLTHGLFSQLLKCLKTDTDVPVLLSGLLIITALLPVVPVSINQYLPHIFDVFNRLASLCLKPPSNIPELYKYHLLVGVYSLHHRLYGMYPYHFLTYLRNVYSRQDQQEVFEHIIKPMIDKVRLHPLLFTTSREKEVSRDRWRQKEVHDILVDCAQFSLDLTEGSTTEMSTPGPQRMSELLLTGSSTTDCYLHMGTKGALADLTTPSPGSLVSSVDPAAILKRQGSGVMTPPPGQDSTAQVGRDPTPQSHQQGAALISPVPEQQKTPALVNADRFTRQTSKPSSEPTVTEKDSQDASGEQPKTSEAQDKSATKPTVLPSTGENQESTPEADTTPSSGGQGNQADLENMPSLTQLPKFLDSLDNHPDGDIEVSEITTFTLADDEDDEDHSECSDTPSRLPPNISTAASMADFMKKVNRLRFNSINMSREVPPGEKPIKVVPRARSCPDLDPKDDMASSASSAAETISPLPKVVPQPPSQVSMEEKMMRVNSSQTSLFALSAALLEKSKKSAPQHSESQSSTESDSLFEKFPYEELFSMSLPFSPYVQCYSCVMKDQAGSNRPALDDQQPLFASYSPVELLDRILDQGHKIHQQGKVYTSPGGTASGPALSSTTDVSVLHGQIDMLHHQLLFERHKRELHAQRNRRLLSRIVKMVSLQEQNTAMKDQLQLQERELTTLRHELQRQQHLCQTLQQTTSNHEADTEKRNKSFNQKLETLQDDNKELEASLEAARADKVKAEKEVQAYQAKTYTLTKEVEALTTKNVSTRDLQEQVKRLNKELLLMGELQQKYQSRLIALNMTDTAGAHKQFLLDTYKGELNTVKNNLSQKTMEADAATSRLKDCLASIARKDEAIADLKQMIESARDSYREEIESSEDKYSALKKSLLALQTEFLTLHSKLSLAEHRATRPRGHGRVGGQPHSPVDIADGNGSMAREQALGAACTGRDPLPDWSAPASISSVESAEEAVAMDAASQ